MNKVFKISKNETQFYLILGDSGMGKSTFMINLFSRYSSILNIGPQKHRIKLFPLGENSNTIKTEITKIKDATNTILLLDGFDELPAVDGGNIMEKFNELIESVKKFRIVIITCRTHFFSSEKDEPFELKIKMFNTKGNGYHIIKKIYLSPFDDHDIAKYINKIYRFYDFSKKSKAHNIVKNTSDLMVRPMLLSYIKEIVDSNNTTIDNTFDIYESLIVSWIDRESNKYQAEMRHEFKLNLIYFTYAIVEFIYSNYEKNGIYIPLTDAIRISESFKINLDEIEIKSRSLMYRNSLGHYKFSHKSFFEFFIAFLGFESRTFTNSVYTVKFNLGSYDFAKKFIEDLVFSNKASFRLPLINETYREYNVELYKKILMEKNKGKKMNIQWLSENSYKIAST